jgi:hypothetical protein
MQPVFALAGRRIDPPDVPVARFPAEHAAAVGQRILELFSRRHPAALACSAACGADLLALEAARGLGVPATVVLPWGRERFRAQSVDDCVGDWRTRFESLVGAADSAGRLIVLGLDRADRSAYEKTNLAILEAAADIAAPAHHPVAAVVVWDGARKAARDVTGHFRDEALRRRFEIVEVPT